MFTQQLCNDGTHRLIVFFIVNSLAFFYALIIKMISTFQLSNKQLCILTDFLYMEQCCCLAIKTLTNVAERESLTLGNPNHLTIEKEIICSTMLTQSHDLIRIIYTQVMNDFSCSWCLAIQTLKHVTMDRKEIFRAMLMQLMTYYTFSYAKAQFLGH